MYLLPKFTFKILLYSMFIVRSIHIWFQFKPLHALSLYASFKRKIDALFSQNLVNQRLRLNGYSCSSNNPRIAATENFVNNSMGVQNRDYYKY